MAATTSAQLRSIAKSIIDAHPQYQFATASTARWSPVEHTVYYSEIKTSDDLHALIHELGHAKLGHTDFVQDVALVRMEREAWSEAGRIASEFEHHIDEDVIEDALDSYREWLHARSRCPRCNSTGVQDQKRVFTCPLCHTAWRANDARQCGLKRHQQK